MSISNRWRLVIACIVVPLILYAVVNWHGTRVDSFDLSTIKHEFAMGHFQTVLDGFEATDQPMDSSSLLMAGESAQRLRKFDQAIQWYSRIADSDRMDASTAKWAMGEIWLETGCISKSISRFEDCLRLNASQDSARDRLIDLLNLCGQRRATVPLVIQSFKRARWSFERLRDLSDLRHVIGDEQSLKRLQDRCPDDVLLRYGLIVAQSQDSPNPSDIESLEEIIRDLPGLVCAHAQLGLALLEFAPERLLFWNDRLPKEAQDDPEVWLVRAAWAELAKEKEIESFCLCQSLVLDPDNIVALNRLAKAWSTKSSQSGALALRARTVEEYIRTIEQLNQARRFFPFALKVCQLAMELNRPWEALGWSQYALSINSGDVQAIKVFEEARKAVARQGESRSAPLSVVLENKPKTPKMDWNEIAARCSSSNPLKNETVKEDPFRISFNTHELDFTFYASRPAPIAGRFMYEMTGGGVGVLDYDRDGWPDLFFAQGTSMRPNESSPASNNIPSKTDCLLRNQLSFAPSFSDPTAWRNVSQLARIEEDAFGQGVAVGDINNDGFDDIYVGNFGSTQLWVNQGDGTFENANSTLEENHSDWTVSAAIADLNLDGVPEIVEGNYVHGSDVSTRLCDVFGKPRVCPPTVFQASACRVLAYSEQGKWINVRDASIAPGTREGNTLGIVVFRQSRALLPSIFFGNDQVANSLFHATPHASAPLGLQYQDDAVIRGVAFDRTGRAQACMGIAAGDANNDGMLDLLLTNFLDEGSTLYLQELEGGFADATISSGLLQSSLSTLGFGAQFIDADNNSNLDLIVLNGHIDDLTHANKTYRMRPQFFKGDGTGRFSERPAEVVGKFFGQPRLGRALATLDADRDGKLDAVYTDLENATGWLHNRSQSGNYVSFHLIGTSSHRNAFGSEVSIEFNGRTMVHQLTTGSGYMASNEPLLNFGLGEYDGPLSVDVRWPNGNKQEFKGIRSNSSWILIESGNAAEFPPK